MAYTDATCDQEHLRVAVLNDPTIPDRTAHLCEGGPTPLPQIMEHIQEAKQLDCKFYAVPCNTSHAFAQALEEVEGITFINMVSETCRCAIDCAKECGQDVKICVLATKGTYKADVYRKHIANLLGSHDIGSKEDNPQETDVQKLICYPSQQLQDDLMNTICQIKAGAYNERELAAKLEAKLADEFDMNNTVFVLACTELSLLLPSLKATYVDSLDVLAKRSVEICGKKVKI